MVTLLLSFVMMAALFLLLYAAVALVQDRRFFTTAPKDIQEKVLDHQPRFAGQKIMGLLLMSLAICMFLFSFIYAGYDGLRNGFSYCRLFMRYLIMLLLMKAFDIVFFDWFLLTRSNFFQHYYPETAGSEGYDSFGYNYRQQLTETLAYIPASLVMAWICTLMR